MPEKVDYVMQKGDSLDKIAKKFGATVDVVKQGNAVGDPNRVRAGTRLKVLSAKFSLLVSKSRNDLVVRLNDTFLKRYTVGTGKPGKTPAGTFVITDKQKDPAWTSPEGKEIPFGDPANILGTRWMSIRSTGTTDPTLHGYGIHGTWDTNSIGKQESAGCVRMRNADVEELFALVPAYTPVTIVE